MNTDGSRQPLVEDNFFSPSNKSFYNAIPSPYRTLDESKQEIRLLWMRKANQNQERIEVELIDNVPLLEAKLRYSAISYAAGSHKETEEIHVNGTKFNAFQTLAKALRNIRDYGLEFNEEEDCCAIWVDQICIDQSNSKERAYQVDHMRTIYEKAYNTVIYLGEDKQMGQGLKFLERIFQEFEALQLDPENETNSRDFDEYFSAATWLIKHMETAENLEKLKAVCEVLNSPWWSRGWVFQEAIVSQNALFLHRESKLNLLQLGTSYFILDTAKRIMAVCVTAEFLGPSSYITSRAVLDIPLFTQVLEVIRSLSGKDHTRFILQSMISYRIKGHQDMKSLLRHSRTCETTDSRDKVYAFIGLANPSYGIKSDYESSVSDVYIEATARILLKERQLDIIFEAVAGGSKLILPSWVTDWSSKEHPSRPTLPYAPQCKEFVDSSYGTVEALFSFPNASAERFGQILRIKIFSLGDLSLKNRFSGSNEKLEHTRFEAWIKKARYHDFDSSSSTEYRTSETIEKAFIKIMSVLSTKNASSETYSKLSNKSLLEMELICARLGALNSSRSVLNGKWCFFVNHSGYMGIASSEAKYDDLLCLAFGASMPFILRKCGQYYKLVSQAYVHRLNGKDAINIIGSGELEPLVVDLI